MVTRSDNLDTFVVFGLKRIVKPGPFSSSNMPCSISSSVSSRGSTLNKIMIGASYSMGVSLFLKFYSFDYIVAGSFLLIIATGIYENNVFDVMTESKRLLSSDRRIMLSPGHLSPGQSWPHGPIITNDSSEALVIPKDFHQNDYKHDSNAIYNLIHSTGVVGFLLTATITIFIRYECEDKTYFFICWFCGIAFWMLNKVLQESHYFNMPTEPFNKYGQVTERELFDHWSKNNNKLITNKILGTLCIFLELTALVSGTYVGINFDCDGLKI
jgi:hypothetical protein